MYGREKTIIYLVFIWGHNMKNTDNIDRTKQYLDIFQKNEGHPLKILMSLYQGYYWNFILSGILYIIKHSSAWVMPIAAANIINSITSGADNVGNTILVNIAVVGVLLLLNMPVNYYYVLVRSKSVRSVETDLRKTCIKKLQTITVPAHKAIQSGRIQSKIMRDVNTVEDISDKIFVDVLYITINIIISLVIVASRSWIEFCFFILMIPLSALLIAVFKKKIHDASLVCSKGSESTSAAVMEMVELVPITRAHGLEDQETKRMDADMDEEKVNGMNFDILQGKFGSISWASFQLFQILCLAFTAYLATRSIITVGDVVLYQSYFTTIITEVTELIALIPLISQGLTSINSISELLLVKDVEDNENKEVLTDLKGEYEFKDVHYQYPNRTREVIAGIDLHVRPHETIAFVGKSGSGKSTLINLIIGFLMPTKGELLIDGTDIKDINLHSYRKFLAVVPQESILFSGTIRENILYGTENVSEERLQKAIDDAGLRDVIDRLPNGLDTMVGERGNNRSGGQKQRIAIARALVRDPRVVIMDEATSALDTISDSLVTASLEKMSKDRTVFIVAHKLQTIRNADRIAVLKDGKIAEIGTYQELMDKKGEFYWMKVAGEKNTAQDANNASSFD